jgi:hypothetical protein
MREMWLMRAAHCQAVHVEVAPPKQAGDPVQDAGLVLDQCDQMSCLLLKFSSSLR